MTGEFDVGSPTLQVSIYEEGDLLPADGVTSGPTLRRGAFVRSKHE